MKTIEEQKNMYILDDGRVRCFLFQGENEALLIDTAFPDSDILSEVQKITSLPLRIVLTHGDMDHTGGLPKDGECYLHKNDFNMLPDTITKHELKDGDILEVGDYRLKVLHTPGHTYGSLSFLEEEKHFILTGDGVQRNGTIFMFGENRNFSLYLETLKKLSAQVQKSNVQKIYPSHSEYPLPQNAVDQVLADAENLQNGKIPALKKHEFMPCNVYQGKYTGFLFQP